MAITNEPVVTVEETVVPTVDRAFVTSPIGWSSILAATAITLGVWLALHLFGLAVGLIAIDPDHPSTLRGVGIGTGVWSLIAPIAALFIGGLVAGRAAPTINSLNAAIHGAVVWSVSALVAVMFAGMTLGALARVASTTGAAVGASAGAAISSVSKLDASDLGALGLTGNDLVAPINEKLAARGMPPVSAASIEAAARDALKHAVRSGQIDRAAIVDSVAQQTELTRAQADVLADELGQRLDALQAKASAGIEQAKHGALQAAETSGKVLLALFGALALGLAAAIGGALLAVRRERRTHVHLPRAT
ncbi:MAG: hypothetical protein H6Q90_7042, partial [Deltaproteobacteria bacterium]|nr:hypothetical protein [Deltaproteobacteria bacterium]